MKPWDKVLKADEYASCYESDPEKIVSDIKAKSGVPVNKSYEESWEYIKRGKERARFKEMLENLLSAVPDTLTVDEVAELTGYHRITILRYVQRKYIYCVNIMGKLYISKQSIINYLATDKAFKNTQKSEWHVEIIKTYMK